MPLHLPHHQHLKDEKKLSDMVDILHERHKYVPMMRTTEFFDIAGPSGCMGVEEINICHFHHILLGGDQFTVTRVCGSQSARKKMNNGRGCLEGLIPVIEDWHTKMCAMKVCTILIW